jgi:hypothetical protein
VTARAALNRGQPDWTSNVQVPAGNCAWPLGGRVVANLLGGGAMNNLVSASLLLAMTGCVADETIDDAASTARHDHQARVLAPDAKVHGRTRSQWEAAFNVWINSIPLDRNPAMDPGNLPCDVGQSGPVFFTVSGVSDCTMPEDKYLFLPLGGASNTYPCADPDVAAAMGSPAPGQSLFDFLRADITALTSAFFDFSSFDVYVDGVQLATPVEAYHSTSTLFTFVPHPSLVTPDWDICLAPNTPAQGTFDGWVLMLEPMSKGTHTVRRVNHLTGSDRTITFHVVDRD